MENGKLPILRLLDARLINSLRGIRCQSITQAYRKKRPFIVNYNVEVPRTGRTALANQDLPPRAWHLIQQEFSNE